MPTAITQQLFSGDGTTVVGNVVGPVQCWRLVYNATSKKVIDLSESGGYLRTIHSVFASDPTAGDGAITSAAAKQQCLDQITALKLLYKPAKAGA